MRCRRRWRRAASKPTRVDIRGHGASGTRGDIGYVGQLEDDLADFVAVVRKTKPSAPLTLIGHSAGGGFALRVAGSPIQNLFARTVLLAPYLGYDAPTNRPNSGGWASADIPRILGLAGAAQARHRLLRSAAGAGLRGAAEFREDPGADLFRPADAQFRGTRDYRTDLAAATKPLTIISGADDEIDVCGQICRGRARRATPSVDVKLIDGVNHMGIVSESRRRYPSSPTTCAHSGASHDAASIDSKQASEALADINDIVRRVRQSRIYNLASLI